MLDGFVAGAVAGGAALAFALGGGAALGFAVALGRPVGRVVGPALVAVAVAVVGGAAVVVAVGGGGEDDDAGALTGALAVDAGGVAGMAASFVRIAKKTATPPTIASAPTTSGVRDFGASPVERASLSVVARSTAEMSLFSSR